MEWKVAEILDWAGTYLEEHGISNSRLDFELILGDILGLDRVGIYLNPRMIVPNNQTAAFADLIDRRADHLPIQYIIGTQEFMSLEFKVNPDVFIPRPETEVLVEAVIKKLSPDPCPLTPVIIDLGTGCGNIAITLARAIPDSFVYACDISGPTLRVARANARIHGVDDRVDFLEGDLFEPLNDHRLEGKADVVVSNPPYVRNRDICLLPEEVKNFEPRLALDGGMEGLDFYGAIIAQAPKYLRSGGYMVLELGAGQANVVKEMISNTNPPQRGETSPSAGVFEAPEIIEDYSGIERVILAYRK